jgi:cytochrome P450
MLAGGTEPPPGLITDLVRVASPHGELTTVELMNLCLTLLLAGFENVTNLIGNAARALAENSAQAAMLRRRPELLDNLADETLRYYSTTQYNSRQTTDVVELHGVSIPAGANVILLRGSANRDERRFAEPDRFDLERPDSGRHVGFGEGATFCTGAALARAEVRIAFRALFERIGDFAVTHRESNPTKLFWGSQAIRIEYSRPI